MFEVRTDVLPGQARGPIVPRPQPGQDPPQAAPRRRGEPVGFPFDPAPKFIRGLIRRKRIKAFDGKVLEVLLGFRYRVRDSCWTTRKTVADELGVSLATVNRSYATLKARGLIALRKVDKPDPDEPRNRTGWRVDFPWLGPDGTVRTLSPGEPPELPEVVPPLHDAPILPLIPEADVSPEPRTEMSPAWGSLLSPMQGSELSPNYCARAPLGDDPKQDDDGAAPPAPQSESPTESSSFEPGGSGMPGEGPPIAEPVARPAARSSSSRPRKPFPDLPESAAVLAKAETIWGPSPGLSVRVSAVLRDHPADWVVKALSILSRKPRDRQTWGHLKGILGVFRNEGGPLGANSKRQSSDEARQAAERAERKKSEALDPGSEPATPEQLAEFRKSLKSIGLAHVADRTVSAEDALPSDPPPAPVDPQRVEPPRRAGQPPAEPHPSDTPLASLVAGIRGQLSSDRAAPAGPHRPARRAIPAPVPFVDLPPDDDRVRRQREAATDQLAALRARLAVPSGGGFPNQSEKEA